MVTKDQFVFFASLDAEPADVSFWNLSLISSVRLVDGTVQVRMSNGDTMNLTGPSKQEFFRLILRHSVLPDGAMPAEVLAAIEGKLAQVEDAEPLRTRSAGG